MYTFRNTDIYIYYDPFLYVYLPSVYTKFIAIAVSLPKITTSPCDQTKMYGDEVSFTLKATSNGTLSYQWHKDCELITPDTHSYCDGAMTPTLKIRAVLTEYEGTYSCLVSNEAGSVETESAQLAVGKLKAILQMQW